MIITSLSNWGFSLLDTSEADSNQAQKSKIKTCRSMTRQVVICAALVLAPALVLGTLLSRTEHKRTVNTSR
jgi:hypothetical protein